MPAGREIVVGVTGFGIYAEGYAYNASSLVLGALPPTLNTNIGKKIRIIKYPEIEVTYTAVSAAVPKIWNKGWTNDGLDGNLEKADFVLHLGQMRSFAGYSFERLAHRDGYIRRDIIDQLPSDNRDMSSVAECPEVLKPRVDIDAIAERVKAALPGVLMRASSDAGRFICEYTFYLSLARLWRERDDRLVCFMHVPAQNSEEAIQRGVQVASAFIKEVIDSSASLQGTDSADAQADGSLNVRGQRLEETA